MFLFRGVSAARRSEGEERMPEVIDAAAAAGLVRDGDSVLFGGSGGGHGVAEAVIEALAARFLATAAPRGLTLTSIVSLGDWEIPAMAAASRAVPPPRTWSRW